MKKSTIFKIGLLLLLLLSLLGCAEEKGVAILRLRMSPLPENGRTLYPEGQGLTITGYTVSGEGPNDSKFSVSTNSSLVEINGLTVGTWDLEATGYNQQGTPIAKKEVTHHLTARDNFVEVVLSELVGEGSVDIGFYWNDINFPEVDFKLELRSQEGDYETVKSGLTVSQTTASARYNATLPCGSYDIAFTLYSQNEKLAGGVEALRILDGCSTTGDISIVVNKEASEPTGLRIMSNVVEPVGGVIEGLPDIIPPNTETTVSFSRTHGGGLKNLEIAWFLNGTYLGNSNPFSFSTHTGTHRLDALVKTELLGSVGTVSKTFRASVEANNGEPCPVSLVSDGEKDSSGEDYWLTNLTDFKFLHDGRLLLASSKGLQLCEIRCDSLQVVDTFVGTGGNVSIDQYPTAGITNILVDPYENIVITTAKDLGIVVFYHYDSNSASLEKIKAFAPSSGGWGSSITNTAIDPLFKTYFVVDRSSKRAYLGTYSSEEVIEETSIKLSDYDYPLSNPTSIDLSPDGSRLVLSCPSNRSFHSFQVTRHHTGNIYLGSESAINVSSNLGEGPHGAAIIGNVAQLIMEGGLHLFSIGGGEISWTHVRKVSEGSLPVSDICFNSAKTKEWIVQEGNTSYISSMNLYNGAPTDCSTSTPLPSFQGKIIDSSPLENFLAVGNSNKLMLFRIGDN